MNITQDDLLADESLLESKAANAVIKIDEHGLSRFAFDQLMWTVGMKGKEAIGGRLHLTNYRLVFKSHMLNRVCGKFSIFLPTIRELRDASKFVVKKLEVGTENQRFEFVVWGIPAFINQIQRAQDAITPDQLHDLRTAAAQDFKKCGEGLKVFAALEAVNIGLLTARTILDVVKLASNPLEAASILNLLELFADVADS
jgi:hypothetical protein